jgi:uncharacterized protein (DUF362 family)
MGSSSSGGCGGFSRRGFLLGGGLGVVAGAALASGGPLAWRLWRKGWSGETDARLQSFTGRSRELDNPAFAMPGPFPGRVIEVRHPDCVSSANEVRSEAVRTMMDRGMKELTGADHSQEAWRRFFQPGDVVGIKVNPVGYKHPKSGSWVVGAISSPAVLLEVVENLKKAGVKARDIIVFERYANEFREAGYERVMSERAMDDVRWYASGSGFDPRQLDISGQDRGTESQGRDSHVVGYDPDVFVSMGFAAPGAGSDSRRFRSHLSVIVTRMVDKFITLPVLKDHRSAGVTLALKNLSHGLNNNVARSHISSIYRLGGVESNPNQCNTFIPAAAGQSLIRQKATLHILDGLIGVYEGGPGCWNRTWGTWRRRSLFFATDPVAMDHVGWDIIDGKRVEKGWPPVAEMGLLQHTPVAALSNRLAVLAARQPPEALALAAAGVYTPGNQETEQFDRRQPEHIILAGTIGLGTFDARQIEHRVIDLKA